MNETFSSIAHHMIEFLIHNYFDDPTKLFYNIIYLYLSQFLDISAKLFFFVDSLKFH